MQDSEIGITRKNTDPLWIQDHFLGTGHTEQTRNATATFVKRNGINYFITCRHVLEARLNPEVVPGSRFPTLALHLEAAVLNFSAITVHGLQVMAAAPYAAQKKEEVDIAICEISSNYWSLLQERKNKVAIDLDTWTPPTWSKVKYGVATGYPDEHKRLVTINGRDMVGVNNTHAVAEFTTQPTSTHETYTIYSRIDKPHGLYFSGLSGGPLYAIEGHLGDEISDNKLKAIGITFEGAPSSQHSPAGFLGENDIYIQALALTPERFDAWLQAAF